MVAVIQTGGKQYRVSEGDTIYVEKLNAATDDVIKFDVLMASDVENVKDGTPFQIQGQEELPPAHGTPSALYQN